MKKDDFTNVCEVSQANISGLDIPEPSKRILASHVLPKTSVLFVSFAAECGSFPTLAAYCRSNNLPQTEYGDMFYRIGTDEGSQLCLTKGDSKVVAIDPTGNHPQRFVNSSIEKFLRLLDFYRSYATNVQSLSEDEADSVARQAITQMREADPEAFLDPDSWWSSVVQQMEVGML